MKFIILIVLIAFLATSQASRVTRHRLQQDGDDRFKVNVR